MVGLNPTQTSSDASEIFQSGDHHCEERTKPMLDKPISKHLLCVINLLSIPYDILISKVAQPQVASFRHKRL